MRARIGLQWIRVSGCCALFILGTAMGRAESLESYMRKLGYDAITLDRNPRNQLFVKAQVESKNRVLLVDTGWSITGLDRNVASKLKTAKELKMDVEDDVLGNVQESAFVLVNELKLGAVRFTNQWAEPIALKSISAGFDGAIGVDFMIRHHAVLDCAAKRLYVRREAPPENIRQALSKTLEMSGYHHAKAIRSKVLVPLCDAELEGIPMTFLLDTGAMYSLLEYRAAQKNKMRVRGTAMRIVGVKTKMNSGLEVMDVRRFTINGADFPLRGVPIGVGNLEGWSMAGSDAALGSIQGIIGAEWLTQAEALFDFAGYDFWFVPAEKKGN